MTLALADADTGRLLHTLSLAGPTTAAALTEQLRLPFERVYDLLRAAAALGAVRRDCDDRYRVEPLVVAALVQQNRALLLGAAPQREPKYALYNPGRRQPPHRTAIKIVD